MAVSSYSYADKRWKYVEVTDGERLQYSLNIVEETPETIKLEIISPESSQEYDNDKKNGATLRWTANKRGKIMHGIRQGNTIEISEEVDGEMKTRIVKIDKAIWIQPLEYGLQWFARDKDKASRQFWGINPSDGSINKLVAKKNGNERIKIGNHEYDTIKVKLAASGWKSLFWSVDYWFRKSDGVFLKFKGAYGFVGTPETLTELIQEED